MLKTKAGAIIGNLPGEPRLLKRRIVLDKTGLSKSHLYFLISQGLFPPPVNISAKAVAWSEAEVNQWITDRIAARNSRRVTLGRAE